MHWDLKFGVLEISLSYYISFIMDLRKYFCLHRTFFLNSIHLTNFEIFNILNYFTSKQRGLLTDIWFLSRKQLFSYKKIYQIHKIYILTISSSLLKKSKSLKCVRGEATQKRKKEITFRYYQLVWFTFIILRFYFYYVIPFLFFKKMNVPPVT